MKLREKRQIWMRDSGVHANQAFDRFLPTYEAKYPAAAARLK